MDRVGRSQRRRDKAAADAHARWRCGDRAIMGVQLFVLVAAVAIVAFVTARIAARFQWWSGRMRDGIVTAQAVNTAVAALQDERDSWSLTLTLARDWAVVGRNATLAGVPLTAPSCFYNTTLPCLPTVTSVAAAEAATDRAFRALLAATESQRAVLAEHGSVDLRANVNALLAMR
jgi:hypothetical protein